MWQIPVRTNPAPTSTIAGLVGAGWSPVWHFPPPHASWLSGAFVRWQRLENPHGSTCFCGLQSHGRLTLCCSDLLMSSLPQQWNQLLCAPFRVKKTLQLIQGKHYFWTGEFCWMLLRSQYNLPSRDVTLIPMGTKTKQEKLPEAGYDWKFIRKIGLVSMNFYS